MEKPLTEAQRKEFEKNLKETHRIMKLRKELAEFIFFEEFYNYQLEQLRKKIQIENEGQLGESGIPEQITQQELDNIVSAIKSQVEEQKKDNISEQTIVNLNEKQ